MESTVRIQRVIDLPRVIVWDALIDPVLVEGWLHPVLRLVGGEPEVSVRERVDPAPAEVARLHVHGEEFGELRISLVEIPGGTRGASTGVTVELLGIADVRFRGPLVTGWQTRLDQLEDLLRGHPVSWTELERPANPARRSGAN
ncbi:SRPBCC domain-containing protein [Lysinimonas soli]|uniref:SRPBCC domain-containing protein n=1 Tax=Lysinimonas soli TaxID=1074233 RepID=A0ABW0NMR8_9MICO